MAEHLFKLKKDGETVGYLKIDRGLVCWRNTNLSAAISKTWYTVHNSVRIDFDTAHPFITKDKNGKDVFTGDRIWLWLIGCSDRATGIIKWQQESHRFVFVEDSSGSGWGFTNKNDIELIKGQRE